MKKISNFIERQDKLKLILYILSFPLYVSINNCIFNLVMYLDAGEQYFNDVHTFGYPCVIEDTKTILFSSTALKIVLFIAMVISDKKKKQYLTEILIIYFLFDFGQIGSMLLCDILNLSMGKEKFDGIWYFNSNFELIYIRFLHSFYITCIIWSILLGIFLFKTKRYSFEYFTKRFAIMPLSGLTYVICRYYYLYHFVWHK